MRARGIFWFKVDDDDYYDDYYLEDMINTFLFSNADAIGKPPSIYFLQAKGALAISRRGLARRRRSVRAGQFICGATLSGRSGRGLPSFSQTMRNAVDSQWVEQAILKGCRLVFGSPVGFVIHRSSERSKHTYLIADEDILARRGTELIVGLSFRHV
jgi:hypothetical protein